MISEKIVDALDAILTDMQMTQFDIEDKFPDVDDLINRFRSLLVMVESLVEEAKK